jgi:hypothetical protein
LLDRFKAVWVVDTEFNRPSGGLPSPVRCVVAKELHSGRIIQLWAAQGASLPFDVGPDALFVAHYSIAEWVSFMNLGWPVPMRVIDTFAEARRLRNGLLDGNPKRCGLLAVAARYRIPTMSEALKAHGRQLAMRDGSVTRREQQELIDYCTEDVETNAEVFLKMLPEICAPTHGFAQALIRGRYARAAAVVEYNGIPFDVPLNDALRGNWMACYFA